MAGVPKIHNVVGPNMFNMFVIRQKADFDESRKSGPSILASRLGRDAHLSFAFRNRQGPLWTQQSKTTMFRGISKKQQLALKTSLDPLARQVGYALGTHVIANYKDTHVILEIEGGNAESNEPHPQPQQPHQHSVKPDLILKPINSSTHDTVIIEVKTKWGDLHDPNDQDIQYAKNISQKLNIRPSTTLILVAVIPKQPSPSTFTTIFHQVASLPR